MSASNSPVFRPLFLLSFLPLLLFHFCPSSTSSSSVPKRIKPLPPAEESPKRAPVTNRSSGNRMCPLNEHIVCNEMSELQSVRCVCTMFGSESPAPEQTCSKLLNSSLYVEASSVKLRLSDSFFPATPPFADDDHSAATSNWADNFLEEKFKTQLAWHFKINKKNILFLRLRCQEDGNVIVQFIVLRRNHREQPPFSAKDDLIDADTVVRRIRGMRELQNSGGVEIMHVEKVDELIPVEVDVDNSRLIFQAVIVGMFIVLTSLCGCWLSCRKKRPEDEGYEDVVQQPDKV
ncbi:hypothetical protein niasHS_014713 [Heterodera schachtii]|uniref:Uncharacterized protein n=1 Tax=Heterodera schachtii TaxID=97005 RepID=A0ABD2IIH5_HETSC